MTTVEVWGGGDNSSCVKGPCFVHKVKDINFDFLSMHVKVSLVTIKRRKMALKHKL